MKHTPGPWKVIPARGYEKRGWVDVVADRNSPVVGADSFVRYSCDEAECHHGVRIAPANAALIAAAPELLEALEMIVSEADSYTARTGKPVYNWLDQARAAIAKAKGEEQ